MKKLQFNQSADVVSTTPPAGVVKKKKVLTPLDNGTMFYQDFKNPYEGISAESYSIKSQLANGVHLQRVGVAPLEGVHGSDKVRAAVEKMSNSKSE